MMKIMCHERAAGRCGIVTVWTRWEKTTLGGIAQRADSGDLVFTFKLSGAHVTKRKQQKLELQQTPGLLSMYDYCD